MRLAEFRKDKTLVERASRILDMGMMKSMIQVLEEDAPHNYETMAPGIPETDRVLYLGKIYGYNMALANLRALGILAEEFQMPEATFEDPTKEQREEEKE
jgi:hypothetical protein